MDLHPEEKKEEVTWKITKEDSDGIEKKKQKKKLYLSEGSGLSGVEQKI